jgi:SnoaL-like protein
LTEDFDRAVEQCHAALIEFAAGNPGPVKELLSHENYVSLAGGFGGVTRGWKDVTANIDYAAKQFGGKISFENLTKVEGQDMGYIVELETYDFKFGKSGEAVRNVLRVTTVFRREKGNWRLVHRHGDPIPAMLALLRMLPGSVVSIQKSD